MDEMMHVGLNTDALLDSDDLEDAREENEIINYMKGALQEDFQDFIESEDEEEDSRRQASDDQTDRSHVYDDFANYDQQFPNVRDQGSELNQDHMVTDVSTYLTYPNHKTSTPYSTEFGPPPLRTPYSDPRTPYMEPSDPQMVEDERQTFEHPDDDMQTFANVNPSNVSTRLCHRGSFPPVQTHATNNGELFQHQPGYSINGDSRNVAVKAEDEVDVDVLSTNRHYSCQFAGGGDLQQNLLTQQLFEENRALGANIVSQSRINQHGYNLLREDMDAVVQELQCCQQTNLSLQADVNCMRMVEASLRTENEELARKLQVSLGTTETLQVELKKMNSAELLTAMKVRHEQIVEGLRGKYDSEMNAVRGDLDKMRSSIVEKDADVETLKKRLDEATRDRERKEVERSETINGLTRKLHESQEQCRRVLADGGQGVAEISSLKAKLEEVRSNLDRAEAANQKFQNENKNLKDQITIHESTALLRALNDPPDDSYAQLNIKRQGSSDGFNLPAADPKVKMITEELRKVTLACKDKTALTNSLRSDLKKCEDKLRETENMLEQARRERSLAEKNVRVVCDGSCQGSLSLRDELQRAATETEGLLACRKKLEAELKKVRESLKKAQNVANDLRKERSDLERKHDETMKRREAEWVVHCQRLIETESSQVAQAFEGEIKDSRNKLTELNDELCRTKECYLECCQHKDKIEEDTNRRWRDAIEEMKSKFMEEKRLEMESLKEFYEAKQRTANGSLGLSDSVAQTGNCSVSEVKSNERSLMAEVVGMREMLEKHFVGAEKIRNSEGGAGRSKVSDVERELQRMLKERNDEIEKLRESLEGKSKVIQTLKGRLDAKDQEGEIAKVKEIRKTVEDEAVKFIKDWNELETRASRDDRELTGRGWLQAVDSTLVQKFKVLVTNKNENSTTQPKPRSEPSFVKKTKDACLQTSLDYSRRESEKKSDAKFFDLGREIEKLKQESKVYLEKVANLNKEIATLMKQKTEIACELKRVQTQNESLTANCDQIGRALETCRAEKCRSQEENKSAEVKIKNLLDEMTLLVGKMEVLEAEKLTRKDESRGIEARALDKILKLENKLKEASQAYADARAEAKKKLSAMQKLMDKRNEETVSQLKVDFVKQLELKDKEKKILEELLKKRERSAKEEIDKLMYSAQVSSMEKGNAGEQMKKCRDEVEKMRKFYSEKIRQVERERDRLMREKKRIMKEVRKYYLHSLHEFLEERFDRSFAIELLASAEVFLDNNPPPGSGEATPTSLSTNMNGDASALSMESLPSISTSRTQKTKQDELDLEFFTPDKQSFTSPPFPPRSSTPKSTLPPGVTARDRDKLR